MDDGHHGLMLEGVARCRARPARKSNVRSRLGLGGSGGTVQAPPRGGRRLVSLTGAHVTLVNFGPTIIYLLLS